MAVDYLYQTSTLPETILQFGSGKFLRAFVEYFVHEANLEGQEVGRIEGSASLKEFQELVNLVLRTSPGVF